MKSHVPSFLLALVMFTAAFPVTGQYGSRDIEGSWQGELEAAGTVLRIVFHLQLDDQEQLSATLDSPDQGATGIGMGEVSLSGDTLVIEAPVIMGRYVGRVVTDSSITGTWHQAGQQFPLDLKRQVESIVISRPQEPLPPFPYREQEVTFRNHEEGFSLGGTLTLPDGEGVFPAVVLVSGSGSQNRDEEIFGHKPFLVIADYLTRRGMAVLRYDDRGVGASGGSMDGATTLDLASDARAAIEFLSARQDIDKGRIGLIGHSEGGLIALMLAAGTEQLSCIVSLAGPGVEGRAILLDQSEHISRLSGLPEAVIIENRRVMDQVYDMMELSDTYSVWADSLRANFQTPYMERILQSIPESSYAWMRYFVMSDPGDYFGNIGCPVLAINGEKDSQVMADKNIRAIREGLEAAGNRQVTARVLPGLNHLFQPCETGLPAEYSRIEWTFDLDALALISDWLTGVMQPVT